MPQKGKPPTSHAPVSSRVRPAAAAPPPQNKVPVRTPTAHGSRSHPQKTAFGSQYDIDSTYVSVPATSDGRRRQARLEDLETNELETYSGEVVDMTLKKKITPRNAFDYKMIDCTFELLKRSTVDSSQSTVYSENGANTDEIKMYASRLETCAKIYGMRVENTRTFATDMAEDFERVAKGKGLKKREEREDEEGGEEGAGEREEERREEEKRKETPVVKVVKRVRKPRRSHVVEDLKELACPETEMNANLISRYWSLIGNVQPGVMKDSWIHSGERIEIGGSIKLVMDPDLTCAQRYQYMDPALAHKRNGSPTSSQTGVVKVPAAAARQSEEMLLKLGSQLRIFQKISIDSCVTFNRQDEKQLMKAAEATAKKHQRSHLRGLNSQVDMAAAEKQFEELCRKVVVNGRLKKAGNTLPFPDFEDEIERESETREIFPRAFQVPADPEITDDDNNTAVETFDIPSTPRRSSRSMSHASGHRNDTSLMESEMSVDNQNSMSIPIIDPLEFSENGMTPGRHPREPSVARSTASNRSNKSRYGSVIKEFPQPLAPINQQDLSLVESKPPLSPKGKKSRSDVWPDDLDFGAEELYRVYELTQKSKKPNTKRKPEYLNGVPGEVLPSAWTTLSFPHHLPGFGRDPDQLMTYLGDQTKRLAAHIQNGFFPHGTLEEKRSLLDFEELSAAFQGAFDESYDAHAEKMKRRWDKIPEENYSLSSDSASDQEDFPDMDESRIDDIQTSTSNDPSATPLQDPTLSSLASGHSPTPAQSPISSRPTSPRSSRSHSQARSKAVSRTVTPAPETPAVEPMEGETIAPEFEWEGWTDLMDVGPGNAKTEKEMGILSLKDVVNGGLPILGGLEAITEEEYAPESANVCYAENIALRDCTGSGVNIGKMKKAVRSTYGMLIRLRAKMMESRKKKPGTSDEKAPHLRIGHIIQWVHLKLEPKHHRHINPSVVFSCVLHLAYENHLHLCNSEDLNDLYVMERNEFKEYNNKYPHLNRLSATYEDRIQRMNIPLSFIAEPQYSPDDQLDMVSNLDEISIAGGDRDDLMSVVNSQSGGSDSEEEKGSPRRRPGKRARRMEPDEELE